MTPEQRRKKKNASTRAWRKKNPQKYAALSRKWAATWRKKNPGKAATLQRAERKKNPEKAAATLRAWRKKNPEKNTALQHAWTKENPGKRAALNRAWWKKNPEKGAALQRAWIKKNPVRQRMNGLWKKFKFIKREAQASYIAVHKRCGICPHRWKPGEILLVLDHCHHHWPKDQKQSVRGALCGFCNTYLGAKKDNLKELKGNPGFYNWVADARKRFRSSNKLAPYLEAANKMSEAQWSKKWKRFLKVKRGRQ